MAMAIQPPKQFSRASSRQLFLPDAGGFGGGGTQARHLFAEVWYFRFFRAAVPLASARGFHKLGPELPSLAPGKPPVETGGSATLPVLREP